MKGFPFVRVSIILLIGAGLCAAAVYAPAFFTKEEKVDNSDALNVGGSSVVFFIMDKWKNTCVKEKKDGGIGLDIIYTSTGSVAGKEKALDKGYQIGFSSAPLTDKDRELAKAKGGEMVQIPVVLIAVAPIYNVAELNDKPPLKLSGEVLGDIFLGKITKWNDPALKKLNEDVQLPDGKTLADVLPDKKITVVHRKDKSGTTLLFTKYLEGASDAWKKTIGSASEEVKWPVGDGIQRNYGVAGHVKRTDGAIGYVETLHALTNKIRIAAVQNADKSAFLEAKPEFVTAAAKTLSADALDKGEVSLANRPGKDAYPICGIEWAICYQTQPGPHKKKVTDFLDWAVHKGQEFTKDLYYAPLPEEFILNADQKIKSIK